MKEEKESAVQKENSLLSPIICFPFFLEIQLLVTVKITGNFFRIFLQLS
jgi:hypothetical protein